MLLKDIMDTSTQISYVPKKRLVDGNKRITDLALEELEIEDDYIFVSGETSIGRIHLDTLTYLIKMNSEDTFSQILNLVDQAIIAIDTNYRIFYANKSYEENLDVPVRKIIGKKLNKIESSAELVRVIETKQEIQKEMIYINSIDKYVSAKMYPVFSMGKLLGAISIFTDITELNKKSTEINRVSQVADTLQTQLDAKDTISHLNVVGESTQFKRVINQVAIVASTEVNCLITGESGTGKEVISKLVHQQSHRKNKPLITVNCAAIPESLIESELFGYEEGAFTGAKKGGKLGKFELAHNSTLFLDEIGDMPLAMQARLLRVLQEGEIEKIGSVQNEKVNVRLIAATNQPLEELVEKKEFREDLYYRLNVVNIKIPPLRERPRDVTLLSKNFLNKFNQKYQKEMTLSLDSFQLLETYNWPGNVRELQNKLERAVILCNHSVITPEYFDIKLADNILSEKIVENTHENISLKESVKRFEKEKIMEALSKSDSNESAIKMLGISNRTFYRKLSEYKLH